MSTETEPTPEPPRIDYERFRERPEFLRLRSRHRRFIFPVSVAFMVWFLGYAIVAATMHDLMATPVWGLTNLGIVLGVLQFVTTFAITMLYVRYANRRLDPLSSALRAELEALAEGDEAAPIPEAPA